MDSLELCCTLLPSELKAALRQFSTAEELRLRCGQKASVVIGGREYEISKTNITVEQILHILEFATGASLHSAAASMAKGYINYKGLRIGICGQAIYSSGQLVGFRKFSSLSIRLPHQPDNIIPKYISDEICDELSSTLIAAPPGVGKTTALRELVRTASEKGIRVSLADERGELSGADMRFKLGRCTDLISDMPKAEAAIMMLRSMNPQLIAMDEITSSRDIEAIFNITGCGVAVFATTHGKGQQDMLQRPIYKKLFEEGVFKKLLTISIINGKREYILERINS